MSVFDQQIKSELQQLRRCGRITFVALSFGLLAAIGIALIIVSIAGFPAPHPGRTALAAALAADGLGTAGLLALNAVLIKRNRAALSEAHCDAVSGALNKRVFLALAARRYMRACGQPCLVIMVDLDDFKSVNDRWGHLEGDRKLCLVSSLLGKVFSAEDLIGRFGGDEFVLYLQGISPDTAEKKLLQFERLLAESQREQRCLVTCSVGAVASEGGEHSFELLLERADEAMYRAKRGGKGRCVMEEFPPAAELRLNPTAEQLNPKSISAG